MPLTTRLRRIAYWLAGSSDVFRALRYVLNGRFAPLIVSRIRPHLRGRVLDIGCGTGELAHFIRAPYAGIDVDTAFLPAARREAHGGWILAADGTRLPFRDGSFGTAILVQALHHLSDAQARAILSEASRCAARVIVVDIILPPREKRLRRFLHDVDRGEFVRDYAGQRRLVAEGMRIGQEGRFWGPTRLYEFSLFIAERAPEGAAAGGAGAGSAAAGRGA